MDNESDTQGWNRFSYVKGNPVVYKDPTGHWVDPFSLVLGVNAAAGKYVYDSFKNGKGDKAAVEKVSNKSKDSKIKNINGPRLDVFIVIEKNVPGIRDAKGKYMGVEGTQTGVLSDNGKVLKQYKDDVTWKGRGSPFPTPPGGPWKATYIEDHDRFGETFKIESTREGDIFSHLAKKSGLYTLKEGGTLKSNGCFVMDKESKDGREFNKVLLEKQKGLTVVVHVKDERSPKEIDDNPIDYSKLKEKLK